MPDHVLATPALASVAGFRLDLARDCLLYPDGAEVPLRPKTYALLRLLLENPGTLVGRQRILDEVWPDVTVTDDNITQCIGEIRRALGPAGRLLRTVPRRGYILEAAPAPAGAAPMPPPAPRRRPGPAAWALLALLPLAVMAFALAGSLGGAPPAGSQAPRPAAQHLFEEGRAVAYRPQGARADNWLNARQLFRQAIAADPRFAAAYAEAAFTHTNMVTSGLSLDREADLREAEALTAQAAVLAPDLPVVHAARAAVFRLQRRPAEALAAYARAVELDPKQHASRANTGLMLILLGRPQEAIAPIQQTLALAPAGHAFTGTWLTYLGIADLQIGQAESAAERFRRSLTWSAFLSADTRRLYLSAALAQEGRQEEAEAVLAEVRARQPELTLRTLQQQELSDDPAYRQAQERFYRGLRAAGLPG